MVTHPNSVRCPWCGAQPSEPCCAPPGPGKKKKLFIRSPLKLTAFHPSRLEKAMKLDGASEPDIERAVAGHLAATTNKYREDPLNSPVRDDVTRTTPRQADRPEQPSAATTAANSAASGGSQ